MEPYLLLAEVVAVTVEKVLEEREEGASDLAKTVLALGVRQHALADMHNVQGPDFCHYAASTLAENASRLLASWQQPHHTLGMHLTMSLHLLV